MKQTLTMAMTFLRIFSRDRQSMVFALLFPVIFISVFSFVGRNQNDPMAIGIINQAGNGLAKGFIGTLSANPLFTVTVGSEEDLRAAVITGDLKLALVLPPDFQDNGTPDDLRLLVDAAQVRQLGLIMPVLEQALLQVERKLRHTQPLFNLKIEDVKARSQSYLDFLVPGLLAFMIMQISIGGSGYNIVEYRRKGILKRLFVTPIQPKHFIGGLVLSRSLICLLQLSVLLTFAQWVMKVNIAGSLVSLYVVIVLATALFLSIGFCMGSLAKTQQSIRALGNLITFPQMFLSGIFYSIDILPHWMQPLAHVLPLSFVVNGLRDIAVNGANLLGIIPDLVGLGVWALLTLILAIRLFVWKEVAA